MKKIVNIFSLLFLGGFFVSCAGEMVQEVNIEKTYLNSLDYKVNGSARKGVSVEEPSRRYVIDINSDDDIKALSFQSCHREEIFPNVSKKHSFKFYPKDLEANCLLEISALNEKGSHKWAQIAFKSEKYSLKAKMSCNGDDKFSQGVEICQGKEGLVQEIEFLENVRASKDLLGNCSPIPIDNKSKARFNLSAGKCVYLFKGESGALFKLYTIGYEGILLN